MTQEIDICEIAWHKIVACQNRHKCYSKWIANKVVDFYHMETKVYINYELQ